ncbi:hypothetical protein SAMN05421678_13311 [Actinopolymorpha cephalotaxi]|uniref:Uncharacterized protein n=1 Tax=Actinopolymorpha cephalotaxi TaxID=504797 RepID=A0A1I3CF88_9ACTN|nr:hypothetical protein [Actinopolymorpha cephalotaxi]NYH82086.1 hypothetical protein [Actinopolymorpha cephalotaxi]SFH73187.1 hypothetical protein SAMN05421678_13311 [Actinopolymorpha cephalotaxi]
MDEAGDAGGGADPFAVPVAGVAPLGAGGELGFGLGLQGQDELAGFGGEGEYGGIGPVGQGAGQRGEVGFVGLGDVGGYGWWADLSAAYQVLGEGVEDAAEEAFPAAARDVGDLAEYVGLERQAEGEGGVALDPTARLTSAEQAGANGVGRFWQ